MAHSASLHTQPSAAKTVADILTAAADLIAKPGAWTQGAYDGGGCYCVAGAIGWVQGKSCPDELRDPAVLALKDALGLEGYDILDWNDAPERTQAEVVAALRAAAEKARTADADKRGGYAEGVNPK